MNPYTVFYISLDYNVDNDSATSFEAFHCIAMNTDDAVQQCKSEMRDHLLSICGIVEGCRILLPFNNNTN